MFILGKWPNRRSKYKRGGRPKSNKVKAFKQSSKTKLDLLLDLNVLSDSEYQTALWYQKMWHLYISVIESPRLQTVQLSERTNRSDPWSEDYIRRIENKWGYVQDVLKRFPIGSRYILDEVICDNQDSSNPFQFKYILSELDKDLKNASKLQLMQH